MANGKMEIIMTMKKNILNTAVILIATMMGLSCSTRADYNTEGVVIDMKIIQKSAGFCEVKFTPSANAWYYVTMEPVSYQIDPQDYKKEIMSLALDKAYVEYVAWRHGKLREMTPYVADFASHSLIYRESDIYFHYLEPDKDYWLIAFVVDPKSNEPCGELFCETVHTRPRSSIPGRMLYKVKGAWDYGYPLDPFGNLTTNVPWIAITFDSEDIAEEMSSMTPKQFFGQRYEELRENKNANVLRGIYAHNNDGLGDGSSYTLYEEGHTYYTCLAVFDGDFGNHAIYKFTWHPDIDLSFLPKDSLSDEW